MRRREFIALIGGAAAAWPLAIRAQQSMPMIGFLDTGSETGNASCVAAFRQGLGDSGFVDGNNVRIEYRWANGEYDQLPALAAGLVGVPVVVLATGGGEPTARAARAASTTIPIVFDSGTSPVELGWAASLNHPGGNTTGVNQMIEESPPIFRWRHRPNMKPSLTSRRRKRLASKRRRRSSCAPTR